MYISYGLAPTLVLHMGIITVLLLLKIHIAHHREVYRLSHYFMKTDLHIMFHRNLNY